MFYKTEFSPNIEFIFLPRLSYLNRIAYFNIPKKYVERYNISKKYDIAIDFSSYGNECALCTLLCKSAKKPSGYIVIYALKKEKN